MNPESLLLVFGDSHAVIWEGHHIPTRTAHSRHRRVRALHLGPALGYNLMGGGADGLGKWGELIFRLTRERLDAGVAVGAVMLCFGEIDVRTQVVRRALEQGQDIESGVRSVAARILAFAALFQRSFGLPVLIWEPVPSTGSRTLSFNPDYPAVGSETERNYATFRLGLALRDGAAAARAQGQEVYSFGAFEALSSCFQTRDEYFEDGCHLNLRGLQVALAALGRMCDLHGLDLIDCFEPDAGLQERPAVGEITRNIRLELSSEEFVPSGLLRPPGRGFCFHTRRELRPHALLDIRYAAVLDCIAIFNRFDDCQDRARSLVVAVGNEPDKLQAIHQAEGIWGLDGQPLVLRFAPGHVPVRFIRLGLQNQEHFHLGEVRVFAKTYQS